MGGRLDSRPWSIAACAIALLAACTPQRPLATPATRTAAKMAPPRAPSGSPWRTALPPTIEQVALLITTERGAEGIDEAGVRWWFPPPSLGGPAETAAEVDTTVFSTRYFDQEAGLVGITPDGRVLTAKGAREPWGELGQLPPEAEPHTARIYRGGVTVRAGTTYLAARDGRTFSPVVPPVGTTAEALFLDRDGTGIGAFVPQLLATTRDGGTTWSPLPPHGLRSHPLEHRAAGFVARYLRGHETVAVQIELPERKTSELSLSDLPGSVHPSTAKLAAAAQAWRGHRLAGGAVYPYDTAADGIAQGRIALDGDDLVVFPDLWLLRSEPSARFVSLGAAVTPPAGSAYAASTYVSSALCRGVGAVVNGARLRLFHESGAGNVSVETVLRTAVGFDHAGTLLTVSPPRADLPTTLRRHDPKTGRLTSETALPTLRGTSPRLVGGCQRPGLWIVTESEAARLDDGGIGPVFPRPTKSEPVAVAHDQELVLVRPGHLELLPSGKVVDAPVDDTEHVALATDGRHGLLSAPSGQVFQTDDGGRSFAPIETPPVLVRQPVVCGTTRCQLGARLVREGFDRGEPPVATWPHARGSVARKATGEPADTDEDEPPGTAQKARARPPFEAPSMHCVPDRRLFGALPSGSTIRPRLGDLLFTTGGSWPLVGGKSVIFFGDLGGHIATAALPEAAPDPTRTLGYDSASGGPSLLLAPARWRPQSTVAWIPAETLDIEGSFYPLLVGRSGEGIFVPGSGRLLLWGDRPARSFPPEKTNEPDGLGVFLETPDDEVLVAMLLGVGEGVRLVRTRGKTIVQDRSFAVGWLDHAPPEELAIGLAHREDHAYLVLSERLSDGGFQLTQRQIAADFTLGPPIAIPRTRTPHGELLSLASCVGEAERGAALIRTVGRHERVALGGAGPRQGHFSRLLQLDEDGACVERTVVAAARSALRGDIVVAGNGGVAVAEGDVSGAHCSPVATHAIRPPRWQEGWMEFWLLAPPSGSD